MNNILIANGAAEMMIDERMHPIVSRKELEKAGGTIKLCLDEERRPKNLSKSELTETWIHASVNSFVPRSFAKFLKKNSDKFIAYAFKSRSDFADVVTVLIVPYHEDSKIGFSVINNRGGVRFDTACYYRFVTIDIYRTQKEDNYDISEYWNGGEDEKDVASGRCYIVDCDIDKVWYSRGAGKNFRCLRQRLEVW